MRLGHLLVGKQTSLVTPPLTGFVMSASALAQYTLFDTAHTCNMCHNVGGFRGVFWCVVFSLEPTSGIGRS